ncbi:MAG: M20/M25/M40 family metallo-hydrolase [Promethearchaeota archaeon]
MGVHSIPQRERYKPVPDIEALEVYVGASSREEVVKAGIHPGAPVVFSGEIEQLNADPFPGVIFGPGMDDLCAVVAMLQVMEALAENPDWAENRILFVATTREEMGGQGAIAVSSKLRPDHVLALDIGIAEKAIEAIGNSLELGKGPAVVWADRNGRNVYSYEVCKQFVEVANAQSIPFQHAVFEFYGSDAAHVQVTLGIPANLIGIPTLFSHNVPEVTSLEEVENCANLVTSWIREFW